MDERDSRASSVGSGAAAEARPLRIVHVDDNPDDRLLAARTLKAELGPVEIVEIGTPEPLQEALENGSYDVLITDYRLRFTDGLKVLKQAKQRWPEKPVIMFTGTGTQEVAVEAMKAGLDDYVTKSPNHYVRLPLAVKHARERLDGRQRASAAERRALEHEQAARAAAERANREKDEMLAMLGHEVRNPLSAISNAIFLLERTSSEEHAASARQIIRRQVELLSGLINDLLDVTRLRTGKLSLAIQPINLAACVELALADYAPQLSRHRVKLSASAVWTMGDPKRIHQVLQNLISNAVRYTPQDGTIEIVVGRHGELARVEVCDTGLGMSPEVLERVFDLFYQGHRGLDRAGGGLGIGLAVVKSLVELHGGQVKAESLGANQGSHFTVTLPAIDKPRASVAAPSLDAIKRLRFLVVEDNPDGRESLQTLLSMLGHEVYVAEDGREGIDLALSHQPEVLIIDIGLPVMSGYEVARTVRSKLGAKPVLVALTGYAQPEDRQRALDAGFDGFVAKPMDPDELNRIVGDILKSRG